MTAFIAFGSKTRLLVPLILLLSVKLLRSSILLTRCAAIREESRVECGPLGTKRAQCESLGCCFSPAKQINATCGPPGLVWVSGRCYYLNVTRESSVVENTRHRDPVVPNIVHMIKFGSESLELFVYLNFLSILEHIKPEVIYIHQVGNQSKESRESWNNILSHPTVKIIETSQKVEIFGIMPHYLDFAHQGATNYHNFFLYINFAYSAASLVL